MTPDEKDVFIAAASMGVACGLEHRYEWFVNAVRALQHGRYDEINPKREGLERAFVAFEKTTAGGQHEEQELQSLNIGDFYMRVEKFYMKGRGL